MYGKWVTICLGDSIECKVWVSCTPSTSEEALQSSARSILKKKLA
ncbi:hypothetical protein NSQ20_11835 [Paenibacillus sp. FSL K6-1122]